MTQQNQTNCIADMYIQDSLAIAGAQVNVHMMLGVHEQTKLLDLTGNGNAISGGDAPGFPSSNAFDKLSTEWHSKQAGSHLMSAGFIGYDFGSIKLPDGRPNYGVPLHRVTKARVERSFSGTQWYGVAIINLPDDDKLNTIHFKQSTPARYWRLRPLESKGGECNSWGVQALEMHDYAITNISNIQDKILLENRDRDYNQTPIQLKGYYELVQANTDLKQFGIETEVSYSIKINFNNCVSTLSRPIVIGDIIELPSEKQYTPTLRAVNRYLEVTDVTWDPTSYTPGWMPTMLLVTAMPAMASQETRDIFGDLAVNVDSSGLFDNNDGNNQKYQDFSQVDQTVIIRATQDVPEKGSEGSNVIREFEQSTLEAAKAYGIPHLSKYGFNRSGLYVEDAMPQNNAPFTEGPIFPVNPRDGDYHRLTYEGLAKAVPARLYRYSIVKARWVYLETDRRNEFNGQKNLLEEYVTSPTQESARNIKNGLVSLK
jgi:hypothetical protein